MQSLAEMLSREDPAFSHQWSVQAITPPSGTSGLPGAVWEDRPNGCRTIDDFIETLDLPVPVFSAEPELEMGSNAYYSGLQDITEFSVTFYEYHDFRVLKWLKNWQALMYDPDLGAYGYPDGYWTNWNVVLLDHSRQKPIMRARLINVFPTQLNPVVLNGEAQRIQLVQQFAATDMKLTVISN